MIFNSQISTIILISSSPLCTLCSKTVFFPNFSFSVSTSAVSILYCFHYPMFSRSFPVNIIPSPTCEPSSIMLLNWVMLSRQILSTEYYIFQLSFQFLFLLLYLIASVYLCACEPIIMKSERNFLMPINSSGH